MRRILQNCKFKFPREIFFFFRYLFLTYKINVSPVSKPDRLAPHPCTAFFQFSRIENSCYYGCVYKTIRLIVSSVTPILMPENCLFFFTRFERHIPYKLYRVPTDVHRHASHLYIKKKIEKKKAFFFSFYRFVKTYLLRVVSIFPSESVS